MNLNHKSYTRDNGRTNRLAGKNYERPMGHISPAKNFGRSRLRTQRPGRTAVQQAGQWRNLPPSYLSTEFNFRPPQQLYKSMRRWWSDFVQEEVRSCANFKLKNPRAAGNKTEHFYFPDSSRPRELGISQVQAQGARGSDNDTLS